MKFFFPKLKEINLFAKQYLAHLIRLKAILLYISLDQPFIRTVSLFCLFSYNKLKLNRSIFNKYLIKSHRIPLKLNKTKAIIKHHLIISLYHSHFIISNLFSCCFNFYLPQISIPKNPSVLIYSFYFSLFPSISFLSSPLQIS